MRVDRHGAKVKKPTRLEEVREIAEIARDLAADTMVSVRAHGVIIECLIGALRDNGVLLPGHVSKVFIKAAGIIDAFEAEAENDLQKRVNREMRAMVERIAKGYGVVIPPPGQIGLQRKH